MQHVDRVQKARDIDDTVGTRGNPQTSLHSIQLETGFAARRLRKLAYPVKRIAKKDDGLHTNLLYQYQYNSQRNRPLEQAGVAAVYTPKDFELNRIMSDLVRIVDSRTGDG
jgi:hypothetical protein